MEPKNLIKQVEEGKEGGKQESGPEHRNETKVLKPKGNNPLHSNQMLLKETK